MSKENKSFGLYSEALADAVEKAAESTVSVFGRHRMPSSGVAYAADLILTADHTIEREENLVVLLPDGTKVAAELAGRDPSSDLALLRLAEAKAIPAEIVSVPVRVGQLVLALGRPSSHGIEASLGVVSAMNGPVRTHRGGLIEKFIRTDTVPLPGFSGGALVNAEGQIVGINTSGLHHGTLITLPADIAWKTAKHLAEHGSIKRGFLGIRSQEVEIPSSAFEALGREQSSGLLVISMDVDSPATASDLMVGDIIVGIAAQPVSNHDELASRLSGEVVGKLTAVDVLRGGQPTSVEVTVGERPQRNQRQRGMRSGHPHGRHHASRHPGKR